MAKEGRPILVITDGELDLTQFEAVWRSLTLTNPLKSVSSGISAITLLSQEPEVQPVIMMVALTAPGASNLIAWLVGRKPNGPPLVALTNFIDMRPVIQAQHLGLNYFLECPLKAGDLMNALAAIREISVTPTGAGLQIAPASGQ